MNIFLLLTCIIPFQMYILCVRDYEFHVLDNAFLVHRPGIKLKNKKAIKNPIVDRQNKNIRNRIRQEYKILFGERRKCTI